MVDEEKKRNKEQRVRGKVEGDRLSTSGALRHLRQRRTSCCPHLAGLTFFISPFGVASFSCPPHGGGAGGGFGLHGEQSLQQPPLALRATSASGG